MRAAELWPPTLSTLVDHMHPSVSAPSSTGSAARPPSGSNTTPQTLRRTYISIALIANDFDLKYVMDQVGHADSTMTMDVYAQLQKRCKRSHSVNFDRRVEAAEQVEAMPEPAVGAGTDPRG